MGCRKIDGVSNLSDLLVCTRPPRVVSIFEPSLFGCPDNLYGRSY